MPNYAADPAEFARSFPARIERPPELLFDFAKWLADRPWGSVGSFDLSAEWSDHNLVAGERLQGWRPTGEDPFKRWIEDHSRKTEEALERDPDILAITRILEPYRPAPGSNPWETNTVFVGWARGHVEIVDASHGHKPLPEYDALTPPLASLRDGAARMTPGVGLWNAAWISVAAEGPASIMTAYVHEPKFFLGAPPAEAFRADQTRLPRAPRRVPDWLEKLLKA